MRCPDVVHPGSPRQLLISHRHIDDAGPRTGRTYQLRVQMASLGLPIIGDPLYPNVIDVAPNDFSGPLHLLALSIAFVDPVNGRQREFVSRRTL